MYFPTVLPTIVQSIVDNNITFPFGCYCSRRGGSLDSGHGHTDHAIYRVSQKNALSELCCSTVLPILQPPFISWLDESEYLLARYEWRLEDWEDGGAAQFWKCVFFGTLCTWWWSWWGAGWWWFVGVVGDEGDSDWMLRPSYIFDIAVFNSNTIKITTIMSLRSFIFLLLIDIRGMGVKLLKKTNGHIDFLAVQDSSIGDLVSESVTQSSFDFSDFWETFRDFWGTIERLLRDW